LTEKASQVAIRFASTAKAQDEKNRSQVDGENHRKKFVLCGGDLQLSKKQSRLDAKTQKFCGQKTKKKREGCVETRSETRGEA